MSETILTLDTNVIMEFVHIPAGNFLMGSDKKLDKEAQLRESPPHQVFVNEFLIGKYPVTNRQYQVFVKHTGRNTPAHWKNGVIPAGKENHPVIFVSWQDAFEFCKWVCKTTGELVRLPSEAEWEKAARGTDGRPYPWGNQKPDKKRCNYGNELIESGKTTPVGQYSPQGDSPYGCADMAGNVFEWVNDLYVAYPGNTNPDIFFDEESKVIRGGCWSNERPDYDMRTTRRECNSSGYRSNKNGFRCVRSFS